ncbi:hypothetical protein [uncultured Clostridium sp.]|uniref:hypothetical protein n=1 Tax=uncultured Clostridium sp. TaxID=59620 RepID=UPI00258ED10D|nr:hypothetical protein [uncultured Clostridium sp.]
MNKRQKKKKEKKRILVIADEANLLTMTDEEREQALKDYKNFCKRYTYRKKYKDLKERKHLFYSFPFGKSSREWLNSIAKIGRRNRKTPVTVTQSLDDFK